MSLGMELGLGPGDFVLDGDPAPLPQKGAESPKFSAHVYCGQPAGWIKMVLGMDVGLSPGDFVLDGDPFPLPKRGTEPPNFRPMSIVAKRPDGSRWHLAWRWALANKVFGLGPGHVVLDEVPVQVQVFIDTLAAQRPNNLIKREKVVSM